MPGLGGRIFLWYAAFVVLAKATKKKVHLKDRGWFLSETEKEGLVKVANWKIGKDTAGYYYETFPWKALDTPPKKVGGFVSSDEALSALAIYADGIGLLVGRAVG